MIKSIEHIAIFASDPKSLAQWYCDTLGFGTLVSKEDKGQYFIDLQEGGVLEILPARNDRQMEPHPNDLGIRHIAFTVDDYDATATSLEERGIAFLNPHPESSGSNRLNFFRDPEGNILQMVWRQKPLG